MTTRAPEPRPRRYTIYIPILSFNAPLFRGVANEGRRRYIVPHVPGGLHERSGWQVKDVSDVHVVFEAVQECMAAVLGLPDEDEPIEQG